METTIELDGSNRIVLTKEMRRAAGIPKGETLKISATPGRILLEVASQPQGRVVRRGKWKVWTGDIPHTPIEEAVEVARHYAR